MKWESFSKNMTRREREAFLGLSIDTKKLVRKYVEQSNKKTLTFFDVVEILAEATGKTMGGRE